MNNLKSRIKVFSLSRTDLLKNLILYLIGVVFLPLGAVLCKNSHMGAGPGDALNFALAAKLGVRASVAVITTGIISIIISAIIRKGLPRITTFVTSFFVGIFVDMWDILLQNIQGTDLLSKIVIFSFGVIIIAIAVASYMISIFPTNPMDDLLVALTERGARIMISKVALDALFMLIAFLLGGEIGVGTVIVVVTLGVIIDFFNGIIRRIFKIEDAKKEA